MLEANCAEFGITHFGMSDRRQGIVHIIGPEQGFTLPGMTIVCEFAHIDPRRVWVFGLWHPGTSEVEHVLATQTLIQKPAKSMRITVEGDLPPA